MNYQEYRQSLNQKLVERVQCELADFREDILSKSPQEIYDAAYQIIIKSDIAECFSDADYSPQAAKALMKWINLCRSVYPEAHLGVSAWHFWYLLFLEICTGR